MDAEKIAVEYYTKKFGDSKEKAFIHFVKELGELARGIEKSQPEVAKHELIEMMALIFYFARHYNMNILEEVEKLYKKKMEQP